jgi:hypothetical protein
MQRSSQDELVLDFENSQEQQSGLHLIQDSELRLFHSNPIDEGQKQIKRVGGDLSGKGSN